MADTFVTFSGWVGAEVTHREVKGVNVANLRIGTTPRLKRNGSWVDGETTWYSVSAWRQLADNIAASIRKGDAVIVHGRLRSDAWKREDGTMSTTLVVEASYVGHDLSRGTSTFVRSTRQDRAESDVHEEYTEIIHRDADHTPRISSTGEPLEAATGDAA